MVFSVRRLAVAVTSVLLGVVAVSLPLGGTASDVANVIAVALLALGSGLIFAETLRPPNL